MSSTSAKLARLGVLSGLLLLVVSPFAAGQSDVQSPERSLPAADAGKKTPTTRFIYRPPPRGAPSRRVSGGTRGSTAESAVVSVLPPEGLASRSTSSRRCTGSCRSPWTIEWL